MDQLEEAVQCVRGLLREEATDFEGEWFQLHEARDASPSRCRPSCRSGSAVPARNAPCGSPPTTPTAGTCRSWSPRPSRTSEQCSTATATPSVETTPRSAPPSTSASRGRGEPARPVRWARRLRAPGCADGQRRRGDSIASVSTSMPAPIRSTSRCERRSTPRLSNAWPPHSGFADRHRGRSELSDVRTDMASGAKVVIVGDRQARPNQPAGACPFCPGGLEAPAAYDVRSFVNRFPPMPDARCEVMLYTPDHEASFASLGVVGARKVVDLWAERSARSARAQHRLRAGVREPRRRGRRHHLAPARTDLRVRPRAPGARDRGRRARRSRRRSDDRFVAAVDGWRAWVPHAPAFPFALRLAPDDPADLPSLDDAARGGLAAILVDVLARLDRLFATPLPYMLWIHQRPFDGGPAASPVHVQIVSPWRDADCPGTSPPASSARASTSIRSRLRIAGRLRDVAP